MLTAAVNKLDKCSGICVSLQKKLHQYKDIVFLYLFAVGIIFFVLMHRSSNFCCGFLLLLQGVRT